MKRWFVLLLMFLPLWLSAQSEYKFSAHRNVVPNGYNFWLSVPDTYDTLQEKIPLILFLHGHSLSGTDLNRVRRYGCLDAISMGRDINAIIVAPQDPGGPWNALKLNNILDWVQERFVFDTNRVYVIGMSMGGYGTFQYVGTYPDRVAAAMAFCGGSNLRDHCGLNKVPLWIIHGTADRAVGVGESQKVVNAMKACGETDLLRFDKFPGINHSQLAKMFYIPETYEWLLSHNKADRQLNKDVTINVSIMNKAYQDIDRSANKIVVMDPNKLVSNDTTSTNNDTTDVANAPSSSSTVSADTTASKPVQTTTQTSSPKYHIVKKGDTLYAISRKYHTTVDKLCKLNKIKETSILSLGQKIRVK
ncbi:MAG: LysM peptidoglycan-binding domain-containing protein [Bacteroidales bacterium]|nr:LysM peptidoglycan-binding domain-containing protein [Bacteroidales bacterium]